MNTLTVTAAATNVATNVLKSAVAVGKVGGMALMSGGTYWNKKKNIIAKDDLAEDTHHQRKGALDVAVKPNVSTSLISLDVSLDEKIFPDEIFGNVLSMLIPIIIRVQNLVVDLFSLKHVDSGKNLPQTSTSNVTLKEWLDDLTKLREPVKDVKIQNKLNEVMERIFENVTSDITSILDCGAKLDLSIVLGMLIKLEEFIKEIENTSNLWCYNDEQQKIIEETKVTVKKRCGVLPIFKTFPIFIDRMELIISLSPHVEATSVSRQTLTKAYEKINKTLFETLEAVVKEISNIDSSSLDRSKLSSDDKEQVNAHIMMVENMHFIHSEIRQRKAVGLDNFVKISKASYDSSFGAYCKVVVRKPLGKLLEFFDGIEQLLKNQKPEEVSFNLTYSKTNLKNVIKKYPGKEIRRSLEELYRRVDKHYSEEEGSGQLLQVVWRGIQSEVVSNLRNFEELINKCYPDSGIRLEFTVDEILTYFSEFAKIH
ncbi:Exocyst complex component 1 [Clydaea vesicula]|uniref:Exocyst complex component 1 n=1 Tax=Clydaea vesicula TaxID=447962 RepID=A0AAD5XXL5_9FUNG|nr:Exocyst complex component 1 [Clydaea vesicula]